MTAHLDLFVRNHLPPPELQPDFINLEFFSYPEILNCSDPLLDDAVKEGHGDRTAVIMDEGEWTYSNLQKEANRIAQVLTEDLKLVPGNRVLLRAPNCYALLYTWFGVIKAGGIAVSTMPLLRTVTADFHQQGQNFSCSLRPSPARRTRVYREGFLS